MCKIAILFDFSVMMLSMLWSMKIVFSQ